MDSINYDLRLNEINTEESSVDRNLNWSSQDYAYKQIVSKRISLGDFNGAIHTASKMNTWTNQDCSFFDIVYKSDNPDISEKAADKLNTWTNQDLAYLHVIRKRISSGDIKKSIQTASKLNTWTNQDHAFFEILAKCDDVEDMESIASKTNTWTNQDRIYQQIIKKRLSNNDVNGAVRTALKINTWTNQDGALFDIFGQAKDLEMAESVAGKMNSNSNIKNAYHILIDKYRANGNESDAARIQGKILKLEEDEKAAIAVVAGFAVVAFSTMIVVSMTAIASAFTFSLWSMTR